MIPPPGRFDDRGARWIREGHQDDVPPGQKVSGSGFACGVPLRSANGFTFGRLRPLHTNAVIFTFAGNAIFAAIYYSTQRLCKARMYSDLMSRIHFWIGTIGILLYVLAMYTSGVTQGLMGRAFDEAGRLPGRQSRGYVPPHLRRRDH